MIPLKAIAAPIELTAEKIMELTAKYLADKKADVWNQSYIKRELYRLGNNKCAYCEGTVATGASYLEVEHFLPKSLYPTKVVEWDNLLPSCKRCNGEKRDHDTAKEPILHPIHQIPNEHLCLLNYRFYDKNDSLLGATSIKVLYLNDRRLVDLRYAIGNEAHERLTEIKELSDEANPNFKKIKRQFRSLLDTAQPCEEYSATIASQLKNRGDFAQIIHFLKEKGLFDEELQVLTAIVRQNAFQER